MPSRQSMPDGHWTFLYIGKRGKTITLRRFKEMVLSAVLLLVVLIGAVVALSLYNRDLRQEKKQLESHFKKLLKRTEVLQNEKDVLLTRPEVDLVEGKPTGDQEGRAFGINNYITMRLSATVPESAEKFQKASVYVFTRTGRLLHEQEFPAALTNADP